MQHNHRNDEQAARHELSGIRGNNGHDDERNSNDRDKRKNLAEHLGNLRGDGVDDEAKHDRNEHDLNNRHKHAHIAHVNGLAGEQKHESRSHNRRHDGGACRHANGKRDVTLGQIRHHVRGRTARAAANENDADGELGGQLENGHEQKRKQRHNDELRADANDNGLGLGENDLEVGKLERHAHAEHHDAEERINPTRG